MILIKLALLTCTFYLAIVVLMEAAFHILSRLLGGFAIGGKPWGWAVVFGVVWFASISLAWHIVRLKYFPRF